MFKSSGNILFLFLFVFIFSIKHGYASQCTPLSISEIIKQSDVIFIGKVIDRKKTEFSESQRCWEYSSEKPECGSKISTFEVTKIIKGSLKNKVTIYSMDACYCTGSYLTKGKEYIVAAIKNTKEVQADFISQGACYGTRDTFYEQGKDFIKELEKGITSG